MAPPRTGRLLRAVAALAAGVLALSACGGGDDAADGLVELSQGTVPADGPGIALGGGPAGRRVAMVGDSITVGSTPGLEAAAAALGFELTIDAEVGRRMTVGSSPEPGTEAVADLLADTGVPDLWVVALGTNDVGQYDDGEYASQIQTVLSSLPEGAPVVWIDVYVRSRADASEQFNRALVDVLNARGVASIGDWATLAESDGVLSDGIHPSDEGVELFVDLVTDQIRSWID